MNPVCLCLLSMALVFAGGCRRQQAPPLESEAAVEAAIRAHLSQRADLAMDKMILEIEKVEFGGETAEADVVFRLREVPGAMPFHYTLRRQGDHWVVESGRGRAAEGMELPPGHPPVGSSPPSPEKLPRTERDPTAQ